jgi:ubiquinol-cytochrome c reductase cytochrome c subunit
VYNVRMMFPAHSLPRAVVLVGVAAALSFSATTRAMGQAAAQSSPPAAAPGGNAENGKRLFTKDGCYECHGLQGQGAQATGPRIGPDPVSFQVLSRYIRKPTGEMPPYTEKVLPDKELADIYAFLKSLPRPPAATTIPLLN